MDYEIEERLSDVELALGQFIVQTNKLFHKSERDMMAFREEMRLYREASAQEMKEFKEGMRLYQEEGERLRQSSAQEMKDFKDEMKDFKEDSIRERREMNKKWGEVTNKLGTFAEDFAFPNVPRIAREQFNAPDVQQSMVRIDRRDPQNNEDLTEFDCVLVANDIVFWLEAKFTVRMQFIEQLPDYVEKFRRCFPEFKGKRLVPIFGSMAIPENVVKKLSKLGFYALAAGDDNMDIVNFKEVKKVLTV